MVRARIAAYRSRVRTDSKRRSSRNPPHDVAASFAVGVFITTLPTLGAGPLVFVLVAALFDRVSKIAVRLRRRITPRGDVGRLRAQLLARAATPRAGSGRQRVGTRLLGRPDRPPTPARREPDSGGGLRRRRLRRRSATGPGVPRAASTSRRCCPTRNATGPGTLSRSPSGRAVFIPYRHLGTVFRRSDASDAQRPSPAPGRPVAVR